MVWKSKSLRFESAQEPMQGVWKCISMPHGRTQEASTRGPLTFFSLASSKLPGVRKSALGNLEKPLQTQHYGSHFRESPEPVLRESEWCSETFWSGSINPSIINNTLQKQSEQNKTKNTQWRGTMAQIIQKSSKSLIFASKDTWTQDIYMPASF